MSNIDNINSHFYRNIGNIISFIVDVSPSTNNNDSYRQQISEKIKMALLNRSNAILIEQISENLSVQMDLQIVEGNNIICQSILVTQGDKQYSKKSFL